MNTYQKRISLQCDRLINADLKYNIIEEVQQLVFYFMNVHTKIVLVLTKVMNE
jgi:hypothetical protein